VDLELADGDGKVIHASSLALRPQSSRIRGWYGAGFRTRFESQAGAETLRLVFHDQGCRTEVSHDR
jgi:hypothetical protein